jgi:hypothetical protein
MQNFPCAVGSYISFGECKKLIDVIKDLAKMKTRYVDIATRMIPPYLAAENIIV